MSSEAELIRLCSIDPLTGKPAERIRVMAGAGLDWGSALSQAEFHRVLALVYKALSLSAAEAVPPPVLERLRTLYFGNLARNLVVQKELVRVLESLREAEIPAITYKGPLLAETAYGDVGLRRFNDLDILIHEDDLERSAFVLAGLGYSSTVPRDPKLLRRHLRALRDFAFSRPGGPCSVEIQWRLAQRYHPCFRSLDNVWADSHEELLSGLPVRTLSPSDTLLALCLHGLYHSWEHLQMVSDVDRTVASSPDIDWPALLEKARSQGGFRILLLGLLLAHQLLETILPGEVLAVARRDRFISDLVGQMKRRFFESSSYLIRLTRARSFFYLEARMIGGAANRARYLWGRLSTPNEEDSRALNLPSPLYPFHPVLRLTRLFGKYFLKK